VEYTSTPQYAFMAWCSVKKTAQGQLYLYLYLYLIIVVVVVVVVVVIIIIIIIRNMITGL
jgi:hypothetical protein